MEWIEASVAEDAEDARSIQLGLDATQRAELLDQLGATGRPRRPH